MTYQAKHLALVAALTLCSSGVALADSGDNSMSPWTGESYSAFHGSTLSGSPTREMVAKPTDSTPLRDVIIGLPREYNSPFRDDTA